MPEALLNERRVILLCGPDRQPTYQPILGELPKTVRIMHDDHVDGVLRDCILMPPMAVLADSQTLMHLGHNETAPLFKLDVAWPVLACSEGEQGETVAICDEPERREPLKKALGAMMAGDSSWQHPRFKRQHLRLEAIYPVRMQLSSHAVPVMAKTGNISSGGLFIVTDNPLEPGEVISLQLMDLLDRPLDLICLVAQVQKGNDAFHLPGMGLRLAGGQVAELRQALASPNVIARLRYSIR